MNGKIKLLTIISIIMIALPILGFTRSTKNIILFVLGVVSLLLVLSLKKAIKILRLKLKKSEIQQQDHFVQ